MQSWILPWSVALIASNSFLSHRGSIRPKFSDYPVKQVYRGTPAPPMLNKDQRTFRTMIRTGAKSKVEFAGHYTVPRWGCGAGCNAFAIVDSITGKVYDGFGIVELPGNWLQKTGDREPLRMEFHRESRLLKINACPNEQNCGYYDYLMRDGIGLKLLRKELIPRQFQP